MTDQQLVLDEDVKAVLEFMQAKIATCKLVQVAEVIPQMASVLWRHYTQEPFLPVALIGRQLNRLDGIPQAATESAPDRVDVGDGSATVMCGPAR